MQDKSRFIDSFKSNKLAVFALYCIVSAFFLSLIAYWIIPDDTTNANQQYPSISLQAPGFETSIIRVPRQTRIKQNIFSRLIHGREQNYDHYAFRDIAFNEDEIVLINHYNRKDILFYTQWSALKGKSKQEIQSHISKNDIRKQQFYLGTDKFGRDILSRLILGIRVSIFVGLLAVFISLLVGVFMGAFAGYYGSWVDQIIVYILNVNWSIPTLLMVFAIVLVFDRGISVIFIAVGLTMWVEVARIVRGQVMSLRKEQYVMAAQNLGYSSFRIIWRHILPNIIGPILVVATANFSTAVLVEAGLSYLGFGVEPPTPSLGNMLNEHYGYAMTGKVFLAIVPAVALMILVLSFNLVGAALRDAFDVKRLKK